MTLKKQLVLATITAAFAASLTAVVYAGPIEDRQAAMKQNGKDMGELAKMMKGEAPYSAAAVKTHAEFDCRHARQGQGHVPGRQREGRQGDMGQTRDLEGQREVPSRLPQGDRSRQGLSVVR